jgi:hypothetical protein
MIGAVIFIVAGVHSVYFVTTQLLHACQNRHKINLYYSIPILLLVAIVGYGFAFYVFKLFILRI